MAQGMLRKKHTHTYTISWEQCMVPQWKQHILHFGPQMPGWCFPASELCAPCARGHSESTPKVGTNSSHSIHALHPVGDRPFSTARTRGAAWLEEHTHTEFQCHSSPKGHADDTCACGRHISLGQALCSKKGKGVMQSQYAPVKSAQRMCGSQATDPS